MLDWLVAQYRYGSADEIKDMLLVLPTGTQDDEARVAFERVGSQAGEASVCGDENAVFLLAPPNDIWVGPALKVLIIDRLSLWPASVKR
jgi:hypothetical protein